MLAVDAATQRGIIRVACGLSPAGLLLGLLLLTGDCGGDCVNGLLDWRLRFLGDCLPVVLERRLQFRVVGPSARICPQVSVESGDKVCLFEIFEVLPVHVSAMVCDRATRVVG